MSSLCQTAPQRPTRIDKHQNEEEYMSRKKSRSWTVAGAARYARDARVATEAHLRRSAIARQWHVSKLIDAYQFHVQHLGNRAAARTLLFGGLGFTPPYPSNWDSASDLIVTEEADVLAAVDLYVLTPQMCDVVVAAALTLTPEDLPLL